MQRAKQSAVRLRAVAEHAADLAVEKERRRIRGTLFFSLGEKLTDGASDLRRISTKSRHPFFKREKKFGRRLIVSAVESLARGPAHGFGIALFPSNLSDKNVEPRCVGVEAPRFRDGVDRALQPLFVPRADCLVDKSQSLGALLFRDGGRE